MTEPVIPVVVFDTGAVLQAMINPAGPAADAIDHIDSGKVIAYISYKLRAEYEDVLYRPRIRFANPHISDAKVLEGLARLDEKAVTIPNPPHYLNYPRDPNDEHIINLAVHVEAEYVITRDRDLLDLMDETQPNGRFFRRRFPDITILDPVAFVEMMSQRSAAGSP